MSSEILSPEVTSLLSMLHILLAYLYLIVAAICGWKNTETVFRIKISLLMPLVILAAFTFNTPAVVAWLLILFPKFLVNPKAHSVSAEPCPACQSEIPESSIYCPKCGITLGVSARP